MSADGETPNVPDTSKMGRPPKLVESEELLKQIEGLGRIQCTQREAAAVLRVHRDTFADFLGTHEKAMEAWEDGQEQGKASLRRMQYKAAKNGNPTMQIWLGKQWLGQKDRTESVNLNANYSAVVSDADLFEIARMGRAGIIEEACRKDEPDRLLEVHVPAVPTG